MIKRIFIKISKIMESIYLKYVYNKIFCGAEIYYLIFSKSFVREQRSVLDGKLNHRKQIKDKKPNFYLLIRNIHRIEKGLSMRDRKNVFAKSYIKDTVNSFESFMEIDDPQIHWAENILSEYFNVIEVDESIEKEKIRFKNIKAKRNRKLKARQIELPYKSSDRDFSDIDYDTFYKLCKQRRSVRWFLNKDVPRELIDKAISAALQSPSACNRQPFEYFVIDQKELLNEAVNLPMGTKGYSESIQTFIVTVGNLNAYFDERDRHLIYIDASLANMSLMFALETLGLSSCPINWPDIEEKELKMADLLNLKNFQRPIMCIGIGYPDPNGLIPVSEKANINSVRKYV